MAKSSGRSKKGKKTAKILRRKKAAPKKIAARQEAAIKPSGKTISPRRKGKSKFIKAPRRDAIPSAPPTTAVPAPAPTKEKYPRAPETPLEIAPEVSSNFAIPTSFSAFVQMELKGVTELEPSQVKAVKEIDDFLKSSKKRYLIIQGFAGTGKTFLLGLLNRYLIRMKRKRRLMAPTGRAARILSRACGGSYASTIHGAIYGLDHMVTRKKGILFTLNFPQRRICDEDLELITIVDEGSLISDAAPTKTKFFAFGYGYGTGRVLYDLLDFLRFNDPLSKTKVIMVGDPCQLPPVIDKNSFAISPEYVSTELGVDTQLITLSEIVRQAKGSRIVHSATQIRHLIDMKIGQYLHFEQDGISVVDVPSRAHLIPMGVANANSDLKKFVIITYSNADALLVNEAVRLGLGRTTLCAGDRLVVSANNRGYGLYNGSFINVTAVQEATSFPSPHPLYKDDLVFRDIDIQYEDDKGVMQSRTIKILENALSDGDETDISPDLRNALFEFFRQHYLDLKAQQLATGTRLSKDPFFNAVRAKFGYAVTCYKAQGGEWDEVGIDFGAQKGLHSEHLRKWSYTAITRAKSVAYLAEAPEVHPLTKIELKGIPLGIPPLVDRLKARIVGKYGIRPGTTADYCPNQEFLCRILTDIFTRPPLVGTAIKGLKPLTNSLRVEFTKGAVSTHIDFWTVAGKTTRGNPKPPMYSAAFDAGITGSSATLAFSILESLAKSLV